MISEIQDVKTLRKRLGMTQKDLAYQAGVSQSLIAKIEAGSLDPTYSNAQRIFSALSAYSEREGVKADGVMQRKIIKLTPDQDLVKAISHMKKFGISQIPVVWQGQLVGYVSDSILLEHVIENKHKKVGDVMQDPPPIVSKNTSIKVVTGILKFYPFVMVAEKGALKGIITKADVLDSL
jgi:predicted transcriptional regulator